MTVADFSGDAGFPLRTWVLDGVPTDEFNASMSAMVFYYRGALSRQATVYASNRQLVKSFTVDHSVDLAALFGFSSAEAKP